jgi:hypothetical protein
MTEQNSPAQHPFQPRPADVAASQRQDNELERFLGGSPLSVFIRLVVLSLIVGFFLVWLDIRPMDVLVGLHAIFHRFWAAGFDAIREIATYVLAGAAIVVPVWLALRLLNMRPKT